MHGKRWTSWQATHKVHGNLKHCLQVLLIEHFGSLEGKNYKEVLMNIRQYVNRWKQFKCRMPFKWMPLSKDCISSAYETSYHTLIFSCSFLASKCSPSVKMSREAIEAIASWPIYSSKSSLPKSIAKIAAGSIIASLFQR